MICAYVKVSFEWASFVVVIVVFLPHFMSIMKQNLLFKDEIQELGNVDEHDDDDDDDEGYCLDRETGEIVENGSVWFDGCRQCTCLNGIQYCSLISCEKSTSSCSNTALKVRKSNACCPVCPFSTNGT